MVAGQIGVCYTPAPMGKVLLFLVGAQLLFTGGDVMARYYMRQGFHWANFLSGWFLAYTLIRQVATFLQLYVVAQVPLGKTMALFGAMSILLSNALGILFLKEVLSPVGYAGVTLAVVAILVLAFK